LSPEQVLCQEVDGRSDLYSVGVVLWELLSNRQLHASEREVELMMGVREGKAPLLAAAVTRVCRKRYPLLGMSVKIRGCYPEEGLSPPGDGLSLRPGSLGLGGLGCLGPSELSAIRVKPV